MKSLRQKEINLLEELHEVVKTRMESGVGNNMDLLNAEIRLSQSQNQFNDADILLHQARYNLFTYMGLSPEHQKYTIAFTDTLKTREDLIPQEEALEEFEKHPLYLSAMMQSEASVQGVKEANSGYLPDLHLGYVLQDFGDGYDYHGFEMGVSIPLWGMFKQSGQIQIAKAKKEERSWQQRAVLLKMKKQVEHAWHSYINSKETIERYTKSLKEKSEKLMDLTLEAYKLGQIDFIKLVEAQQLYLSNQNRYLDALRDYYLRLAELEQYIENELVY